MDIFHGLLLLLDEKLHLICEGSSQFLRDVESLVPELRDEGRGQFLYRGQKRSVLNYIEIVGEGGGGGEKELRDEGIKEGGMV